MPGLCKAATVDEIEANGWTLNPGRYVGVADRDAEEFDFSDRLGTLNEELEMLTSEARQLEEQIAEKRRRNPVALNLSTFRSRSKPPLLD